MQDESKQDDYRDDAREFARSSDLAQNGTTGRYAGGGPTDSQQQVREKGSQDAWQNAGAAKQAQGGGAKSGSADQGGDARSGDGDQGGDVRSRSADPGQSSYGGFRTKGAPTPVAMVASRPTTARGATTAARPRTRLRPTTRTRRRTAGAAALHRLDVVADDVVRRPSGSDRPGPEPGAATRPRRRATRIARGGCRASSG